MRTVSRKGTASIGVPLLVILCAAFPVFGDDSAAGVNPGFESEDHAPVVKEEPAAEAETGEESAGEKREDEEPGGAIEPETEPMKEAEPADSIPPSDGETLEKENGTISLSAQGMDIREILSMFSRAGEISIVSSPEIVGTISLNLLDVPFEEALDAVITMAGFQIVRKGDIYFVHSPPIDDLKSIMLREVSTHRLDYAQVEDIRIIVQDMLSPVGKAAAYPATRTLIIEDRPDVLERVAVVVSTLDIPPRQVLIEARIIEVHMSDDIRFGIDWSLLFSSGKGSGDVLQSGFAAPANTGSEGLFLTWGEGDFAAAIQSLEGVEELNTVASPRLLVVDGKEAQIIIGGQLGFSVITTVENTVIQSVQFLDTGAQLKLTPTITGDGFIQMKIHPEVSNGVIEEGLPSKTTAEVTTEVLVKDGQTLLIGGLIRERDESISKGIPFLRNVPVIGKLFGSTIHSKSRSEMITLITPRILEPGETIAK